MNGGRHAAHVVVHPRDCPVGAVLHGRRSIGTTCGCGWRARWTSSPHASPTSGPTRSREASGRTKLLARHTHVVEARFDDAARGRIGRFEAQSHGLPGERTDVHRLRRPCATDHARRPRAGA